MSFDLVDVLRPWHPTGSTDPSDYTSVGIDDLVAGEMATDRGGPSVIIAVVARRHRVRLATRLRRAGFHPQATMLLIPRWPNSEHLLSIGPALADGAARHLEWGRALSVLRWLADRGWGRTCIALFAPSVGTVATVDPESDPSGWMANDVPTPVMLHVSRRPRRDAPTQLALLYPAGAASPAAVVKYASQPSGASRLRTEHRALEQVGPSAVAVGIATPTVLGDGPGHVTMSAVVGRPLNRLLAHGDAGLDETAASVLDVLERWQSSTMVPVQPGPDQPAQVWIDRLAQLATAEPALRTYASDLGAIFERVLGRPFPTVCRHGDLTTANVVRADDRSFGVLDWESASVGALPTTDDWYFAVDALAAARSCSHADALDSLLTPRGGTAQVLVNRINRTLTKLGVGADVATIAFHATWIEHAHNELTRGTGRRRFLDVLSRLNTRAPDGGIISVPPPSRGVASDHRSTNASPPR